jgi:GNAT superfamily N-acetyltransferase
MPLIRAACPEDIPKLAPIERSAASSFREANLAWVADGETLPPASLADFCRNGSLWVAVTDDDEPVGFLAAHELDKAFYIAEVSVTTSHQRQGIGAHLVSTAMEYARAAGFRVVTLTTYRDLSWNGPFYTKLGFSEINAEDAGPGHLRKVCEEAKAGHDPSRRCVMAKRV